MPRGVPFDHDIMLQAIKQFILERRRVPDQRRTRPLEERNMASWLSGYYPSALPIGAQLRALFSAWGITRKGPRSPWSLPTNLPTEGEAVTEPTLNADQLPLQGVEPTVTPYAIGDVLEITAAWPPVFRPLVGRRAVIRSGEESPDALGFSAVVVVLEDDGITETTHTFAVTTIPGEPAPLIYCPNGWKVVDHLEPVVTWVRPRTLMDDWNDVHTFVSKMLAAYAVPEEQRVLASLNRLKPTN